LQFKILVERSQVLEILAENLSSVGLINLNSFLDLISDLITHYDGNSKVDVALFLPNLLLMIMCFGALDTIDTFKVKLTALNEIVSKIEKKLNEVSLGRLHKK
jgi:hypothetical protein